LSENEWYKTGDVGYFDEIGRLFVLGRINQMLKIPGQLEMVKTKLKFQLKLSLKIKKNMFFSSFYTIHRYIHQ
jgi:long-subunit acyl-CoA synthetase (AMP-forming)